MMIRAPWSDSFVSGLNEYQASGRFHPFTCGGVGDDDCREILVADREGWKCPKCDYTQDWAHEFMGKGNNDRIETTESDKSENGISGEV